jgi:hypothetical protein
MASVNANFTTAKSSFINVVNTTTQMGGSSDMTAGLTAAQNQFTALGRPDAYRILAVLSDGTPNLNISGIAPKLDELAATGVHVFPIMVAGGNATFMQSFVRNEGQFFTLNSNTYSAFNNSLAPIIQSAFFGDYNHDDRVDAADYTIWRMTLDSNVMAYSGADGNGNGMIDAGDYGVWRFRFGTTIGSSASTAVIPEPTMTGVLIAALSSLSARRCKSVFHYRA